MGNDRWNWHDSRGSPRLPALVAAALLASCAAEPAREVTVGLTTEVGDRADHVHTFTNTARGQEEVEAAVGTTLVDRLPFRAAVFHPVDAVFIGVSNFSAASGKVPAPAHAIGAGYVHALFREAVERQPRDEATGRPTIAHQEIGSSQLRLFTDLRLDPLDTAWHADDVALVLDLLEERVNDYPRGAPVDADGLWAFTGTREPLSKQRILEIARQQADALGRREGPQARIAVFYLASHGRLGPDGRRYAMAADSTRDLSTWIRYDEIADLFKGTHDGRIKVSAIVLFDTCLESQDASVEVAPYTPPPGTIVVAAAAPGQYSWHWSRQTPVQLLKDEKSRGLFTHKSAPADVSFYSSMSVLPIALATAIQQREIDCARHPYPDQRLRGVSAFEALNAAVALVPDLADSSDDRRQTAQMFVARETGDAFDAVGDKTENVVFAMPCEALDPAHDDPLQVRHMIASAHVTEALRRRAGKP
jgi:hypothetical protein